MGGLVQEFKHLVDHFTAHSLEATQLNQTILIRVKAVWKSLAEGNSILLSFFDSDTIWKALTKDMARILFIAKYVGFFSLCYQLTNPNRMFLCN